MNDTTITTEIEMIIETLDFMFADFSDLSSSEKLVERISACRRLYVKNGLCDELDYLLESFRDLADEDFISLEEFIVISNFITAHD